MFSNSGPPLGARRNRSRQGPRGGAGEHLGLPAAQVSASRHFRSLAVPPVRCAAARRVLRDRASEGLDTSCQASTPVRRGRVRKKLGASAGFVDIIAGCTGGGDRGKGVGAPTPNPSHVYPPYPHGGTCTQTLPVPERLHIRPFGSPLRCTCLVHFCAPTQGPAGLRSSCRGDPSPSADIEPRC